MAQVKGTILYNARAFVRDRGGDAAWDRVLACLPSAVRREVETSVAVGWYPILIYLQLLGAMESELVDEGKGLPEEYGRFAAQHDLNKLFRVLLRIANPAYVIEQASQVWSRYHDSGQFSVVRKTPTHAVAKLANWGAVDPLACRVLAAYIERMLELVGAERVSVSHPQCRAAEGSICEFELRWQ